MKKLFRYTVALCALGTSIESRAQQWAAPGMSPPIGYAAAPYGQPVAGRYAYAPAPQVAPPIAPRGYAPAGYAPAGYGPAVPQGYGVGPGPALGPAPVARYATGQFVPQRAPQRLAAPATLPPQMTVPANYGPQPQAGYAFDPAGPRYQAPQAAWQPTPTPAAPATIVPPTITEQAPVVPEGVAPEAAPQTPPVDQSWPAPEAAGSFEAPQEAAPGCAGCADDGAGYAPGGCDGSTGYGDGCGGEMGYGSCDAGCDCTGGMPGYGYGGGMPGYGAGLGGFGGRMRGYGGGYAGGYGGIGMGYGGCGTANLGGAGGPGFVGPGGGAYSAGYNVGAVGYGGMGYGGMGYGGVGYGRMGYGSAMAGGCATASGYGMAGGYGGACGYSGVAAGYGCGVPCYGGWYASVGGLIMGRDHANCVYFSADANNLNNQNMCGVDAMGSWSGGWETNFGHVCCNGGAIGATFWMLDGFQDTARVTGTLVTPITLTQLPNLNGRPVGDYFDGSPEHRLFRRDSVYNLELNYWSSPWYGSATGAFAWRWLSGVRWFRFDESLVFGGVAGGSTFGANGGADEAYYDISVVNNLIGPQIGSQFRYQMLPRLGCFATPKVGLFANQINHRSSLYTGNGVYGFDIRSNKTDVSVLAQIDLGLTYQFNCAWYAYGGYRLAAISGIALADQQVPFFLNDYPEINRVDSNGSLLLHGAMMGVGANF